MQKLIGILIISMSLTACFNENSLKDFSRDLFLKSNKVEVSGTTSGYGILKTDGIADFGLVLKNFSKQDLFQIRLDDLMSESIDKLNVFGKTLEIPSNVALPQQSERYFITIRLNKPTYRVYFEPQQDTSLVILHGQFPFSDVIDGFQDGKSLLELAGLFNILSYSEYPGSVEDSAHTLKQDLSVGQTLLSEKQNLKAPSVIAKDFNFVAVSLLENSNALSFFPTDIKIIKAGKSAGIKVNNANAPLFSGLFHNSFAESSSSNILKHKMSLQFHSTSAIGNSHLGFIENLQYSNATLSYQAPALTALSNGVMASTTGKMIRIFKTHQRNGAKLNTEELIHSQTALHSWMTSREEMLDFENIRETGAKYRIEVSLFASSLGLMPTTEAELFEISDLVTKNAFVL